MKILFLQQFAILKAKHSRRPQSFWWNMTKLPSNDEITLFDGSSQKFFPQYSIIHSVSPSAKIATWRNWFRLSRDVYVGNRSFASYTKTKSVESAVWCLLTRLDDGDSQQDRNNWTRFRVKNNSFLF